MVRSQCRVLESFGGGIAGSLLTIRLSPEPGRDEALRGDLRQRLQALPQRAGLTAAHLLQTQTPPAALTTEQRIRGGADRVADRVVLAVGYDRQVLLDLAANELSPLALAEAGAMRAQTSGFHRLSYTTTPNDF